MANTEEIIQPHTPLDITKESIKLTKNSKGFTWEIKIIGSEPNGFFSEADFEKLKKYQKKMQDEYGVNDDN
jgi:hypothetical protein